MAHMELFANFSFEWIVPELDPELRSYCMQVAIRTSLDTPYLMHAILAISARHLSVFGNPGRAAFYRLQAVELQNQSIALFNTTGKPALRVDPSNCVAMLLFASLLARHLLTDVLSATRESSSLQDFLDSYLHYITVHSGVRAIVQDSWSAILESQLRPLMDWGRAGLHVAEDEADNSKETGPIRKLLDSSSLGEHAIKACKSALSFLQIGLGEPPAAAATTATTTTRQERRMHIIFNWAVMVPAEFTDLLKRRVPEAIAVLGYYAVLLHYGRDNWQVGDIGAHLLALVADHLGTEWDAWLTWPRDVIARDKA